MSSQTDHSSSAAAAKAQAKADKAYQKAMRPWFKKKRFIVPLVLIVLIVLASLFGGGDEQTNTGAQKRWSAEPRNLAGSSRGGGRRHWFSSA